MHDERKPAEALAAFSPDTTDQPPPVERGDASDCTPSAAAASKIFEAENPPQAVCPGHNCRMG